MYRIKLFTLSNLEILTAFAYNPSKFGLIINYYIIKKITSTQGPSIIPKSTLAIFMYAFI
jgi:hypothetical protein